MGTGRWAGDGAGDGDSKDLVRAMVRAMGTAKIRYKDQVKIKTNVVNQCGKRRSERMQCTQWGWEDNFSVK